MKQKELLRIILLISIFGLAFTGYLTFGTLISGSCPVNGECPYFLGYPACDYGLVMFLIIFIISLMSLVTKFNKVTLLKILMLVSLAGVIFSGYFSLVEMMTPRAFTLLLPTCIYGLIMYLIIEITSFYALKAK